MSTESEDEEKVNHKEWRRVISVSGGQDILYLSEWNKNRLHFKYSNQFASFQKKKKKSPTKICPF